MEPEIEDALAAVEVNLAALRLKVESEIASHGNCQMLLDAAMTTANAERARADLAERKLVAIRKEYNS